MSRIALCVSVLAVLVFGPGCKGSCQQLGQKLCACAGNTSELNACNQAVSTEHARVGTTQEQEAVCQSLLAGCDCHTINTTEGKQACGIARPPPPGGVVGG